MSANLLELAAFVTLGIGALGLFIRLGGAQLPSHLRGVRFRRKLRGLDAVVAVWERQLESDDPDRRMPREMAPRLRRDRRPES